MPTVYTQKKERTIESRLHDLEMEVQQLKAENRRISSELERYKTIALF